MNFKLKTRKRAEAVQDELYKKRKHLFRLGVALDLLGIEPDVLNDPLELESKLRNASDTLREVLNTGAANEPAELVPSEFWTVQMLELTTELLCTRIERFAAHEALMEGNDNASLI